LRSLVPSSSRRQTTESAAVPLELGALLSAAAKRRRTLLSFAPPLWALAAASAGILRAAREKRASVVLRVDLAETKGRGYAAALAGIGRACDVASYDQALGVVAEIPVSSATLGSGEAGRQIGEALAAGFPSLLLQAELPLEITAIIELLSAEKELQLGFALGLSSGIEPEGFLADVRAAGLPLVAVRGDSDLALAARAFRWAEGGELFRDALLEERPPALDVPFVLPADARGDRAEALAYFAAEAALGHWKAVGSAAQIASALLERA
jgi:hypothetical protein